MTYYIRTLLFSFAALLLVVSAPVEAAYSYPTEQLSTPPVKKGPIGEIFALSNCLGEQWDPNAQLYYNRARYMDPGVGRFVSVDPFAGIDEMPLSLHPYLYAHLTPVNLDDPSGKFPNLISAVTSITIKYTLANISIMAAGSALALIQNVGGGMMKHHTLVDWTGEVSTKGGGIFPFQGVFYMKAKLHGYSHEKNKHYWRTLHAVFVGVGVGAPISWTSEGSVKMTTRLNPDWPELFTGTAVAYSLAFVPGGNKRSSIDANTKISGTPSVSGLWLNAGFGEGIWSGMTPTEGFDIGLDYMVGSSWSTK